MTIIQDNLGLLQTTIKRRVDGGFMNFLLPKTDLELSKRIEEAIWRSIPCLRSGRRGLESKAVLTMKGEPFRVMGQV